VLAAAYLRVSTLAQADADRFGYGRQAHEISEYARKHNLELVREYRDAITGTSTTRVGLQGLKADAGTYDVVLISGVDRLARSVGASYQVLAELLELGLAVHSAEFGVVDLDDDQSLIQFNLRSLFAHLERNKILQRTRAGRRLMADKGLLPGGIRTYGYRGDGKGGAEIVPEQAAIVRRVFNARIRGESFRQIGWELQQDGVPIARPHRSPNGKGFWGYGQVGKLVKNRAYKGEYRFTLDGRPYVFEVPAIVSVDVWERAQPRKRGAPAKLDWPLLGHIRCGECGRRMHAKQTRRKGAVVWQAYRCQAADRRELECSAGMLVRASLEARVEAAIREHFADARFVRDLLAASDDISPHSAARVQELEIERARLLQAYRKGIIGLDEFAASRKEIDESIRALSDTPPPELPVESLMGAAAGMPLGEFLANAGIVVVASRDFIAFEIE
jgi:site-specific DNA recombinase